MMTAYSPQLRQAPAFVPMGERRLRLARMLDLWPELVDRKVGIIQCIEESPIDDDDPNFYHYFSKACDTARFTGQSNFSDNGGASTDRFVAIAKAMGEAVERYCAAIYDVRQLQFTAYDRLAQRAVHPRRMQVYRDDQFRWEGFPWRPFTTATPVHWTQGTSLSDGQPVLLPAAAVYVPFYYSASKGVAPILQPISTGLACGISFEDAAVSALCEVLERDAFTITWQSSLSRPRIIPDTLPEAGKNLIARFAAVGLQVRMMDITNDAGVATVLTVALSEAGTSPAVAVASATDVSRETALLKSLDELAHTRKYAKQLMIYTPELEVREGHPSVKDQRDHLRFYCPQSARRFAEFLWTSPEEVPFENLPDLSGRDRGDELNAILWRVTAVGLEPVVCDLTTPDVARLGLAVVRAVIPGAHPLYMGYRNRALGVERLYEVPRKLGSRSLDAGGADNLYPHPFP